MVHNYLRSGKVVNCKLELELQDNDNQQHVSVNAFFTLTGPDSSLYKKWVCTEQISISTTRRII